MKQRIVNQVSDTIFLIPSALRAPNLGQKIANLVSYRVARRPVLCAKSIFMKIKVIAEIMCAKVVNVLQISMLNGIPRLLMLDILVMLMNYKLNRKIYILQYYIFYFSFRLRMILVKVCTLMLKLFAIGVPEQCAKLVALGKL